MSELAPDLAGEDYCYLTTTGRVSGEPREIEIWFGLAGTTLYMLSGGGEHSNWVRNLKRIPEVRVRIGERAYARGHADLGQAGLGPEGVPAAVGPLDPRVRPGCDAEAGEPYVTGSLGHELGRTAIVELRRHGSDRRCPLSGGAVAHLEHSGSGVGLD